MSDTVPFGKSISIYTFLRFCCGLPEMQYILDKTELDIDILNEFVIGAYSNLDGYSDIINDLDAYYEKDSSQELEEE
jgi:hypothetical protein